MLALGVPAYLILTFFLLFAMAVVVTYTFSLVRHAKTLAADAKKAAERLNDAARDVESQVHAMSKRTDALGGRRPPSGRRGRV
ncbi:MAG: hypothetical protein E6G59_06530 [Actinobacteria bacterium]|nr:MAG: hypothetical protein E6G59_06530 [Actinomycetota bacterium]TMK84643.1 MAG: hypothetical protein E6G46_00105 [Actinomycetota bacterium]